MKTGMKLTKMVEVEKLTRKLTFSLTGVNMLVNIVVSSIVLGG